MRQSKNDVVVRDWKYLLEPCRNPSLSSDPQALRTMAIVTGVVGWLLIVAMITLL